ncbi:MAG: hypothetical protein AAB682_02455 [Patescibacteria group bacterium]
MKVSFFLILITTPLIARKLHIGYNPSSECATNHLKIMLEYNEIKEKKVILFDNEPYEVLESHVFRKQQRKPVNATKMRNLISGRIMEHSFHASDKAEEAELTERSITFLYVNKGEYWFTEANDPSKRFKMTEDEIGEKTKYLKENSPVTMLMFEDIKIGIKVPIKMEFKIKEAPPGIKGDSSRGGMKQIVLENGMVINAPLFVTDTDTVIINTDSGEYVERK